MKVPEMPDRLLFSQRKKLGESITKWIHKNSAENCPMNVVAWLSSHGMLDAERVREYLTKKDDMEEWERGFARNETIRQSLSTDIKCE